MTAAVAEKESFATLILSFVYAHNEAGAWNSRNVCGKSRGRSAFDGSGGPIGRQQAAR